MLCPLSFLSGSPGAGEWLVLFIVILIFFGPRRLPEIVRMIGRTVEQLRRASQDFKDQVMQLDRAPPPTVEPPANGDGTATANDGQARTDVDAARGEAGRAGDEPNPSTLCGGLDEGVSSGNGGANDLAR